MLQSLFMKHGAIEPEHAILANLLSPHNVYITLWATLVAQMVKNLPTMQDT